MTDKTRILFVEDDPVVARIYSRKLAEADFEVAVAADGEEAKQRLAEFKPDLVVLDLMIPKTSGLAVLQFIRQHPDFKATRVIVFSNAFLRDLWDRVAALAADEMLLKSGVTPPALIENISRVLSRPPAALATRDSVSKQEQTPAPAATGRNGAGPKDLSRGESISEFRTRMRADFFTQVPAIANALRLLCGELIDANDPRMRALRLEALSRKVYFLTHMTSMAGCHRIAQLSNAFEALLCELQSCPDSFSDSVRNTISTTVAFLASCLDRADHLDEQCPARTTVLVIDDDQVSNGAVKLALSRANLAVTCITHPFDGLEKLRHDPFDVVLLDISMPAMDGLALCERMRRLPHHKHTPVIFITSYGDFSTRIRSMQSGGDDLIAKPIFPVELPVKVIAHVLKRKLEEPTPMA